MMPDFSPSNNLIIIFALAFIGVAVILIFFAVREALTDAKLIRNRLAGNWTDDSKGSILRHHQAFDSFSNHLTLPDDEEVSKVRAWLARAGYYGTSSVKYYYALRILCLVVPQLIFMLNTAFFAPNIDPDINVYISCGLILLGMIMPPIFIGWRVKQRRQQIKDGFPDMMDLMVASIEAGLGMDAALLRVSNEIGGRYPALKINLDLLNMELRAGRERHSGMMNFANRVDLEQARALAVMLRQSEEMGSSLGKALRTFSEDMRNKRLMLAEEKAMALPAKLTVPLIFFIFPAIMTMLLVPAGIRIAEGLGAS